MNGVADVFGFRTHLDRQADLGQQVTGVHADDRTADDAVGFFVEDQLGEALGAADADRAATGGPRELGHADLQALGLGFGLGHANPGDSGLV